MKSEDVDNYGRPKSEYISKIQAMSESDLQKETERRIRLSAYASNHPRSDYHWQLDACYDEYLENRGGDSGYEIAYKNAMGRM